MGAATKIEWTDRTWNPIRGCSRVSAGCVNCYAERQAIRHAGPGRPFDGLVRSTPAGPRWTGKVRLVEDALLAPLSWRKPQRVFVNSMSDLFHEALPDEAIDRVLAVMALSPRHTFQALTKRPERMLAYFSRPLPWAISRPFPLPNVWLGVSVENQEQADLRIPHLLRVPAAVRFLSVEPLLGPVDLAFHLGIAANHDDLRGEIDLVIVGGESGHKARPCDVAWIRDVVLQCREAGTACFVKQVGAFPVGPNGCDRCGGTGLLGEVEGPDNDRLPRLRCGGCCGTGREAPDLNDPKGGDPAEWPADLRVREFPGGGA